MLIRFEEVVCFIFLNGGYFIEWECSADLSADTIEVQREVFGEDAEKATTV